MTIFSLYIINKAGSLIFNTVCSCSECAVYLCVLFRRCATRAMCEWLPGLVTGAERRERSNGGLVMFC